MFRFLIHNQPQMIILYLKENMFLRLGDKFNYID